MVKALAMSACTSSLWATKRLSSGKQGAKCCQLQQLHPSKNQVQHISQPMKCPQKQWHHCDTVQRHGMEQQAACMEQPQRPVHSTRSWAVAQVGAPRMKLSYKMLCTGTSMQDRSGCNIKCHLDTITTCCTALHSHCRKHMLQCKTFSTSLADKVRIKLKPLGQHSLGVHHASLLNAVACTFAPPDAGVK
jgi:hypothetical protein